MCSVTTVDVPFMFVVLEHFGLQGMGKDYHYLNQSGVFAIDGKDDNQDYVVMRVRNICFHFIFVRNVEGIERPLAGKNTTVRAKYCKN